MKFFGVAAMASAVLAGCASQFYPGTFAPSGTFSPSPYDIGEVNTRMKIDQLAISSNEFLASKGEDELIAAVLEGVARPLKDPESARFRDVRLENWKEGRVVCGEVNGKNSYGAYAGYTKFIGGGNKAITAPNGSSLDQRDIGVRAAIDAACK